MARNTTRIQKLTRVTELADGDIIPTGPASGDRAKGIEFVNLKNQVGSDQTVIEVAGDYEITPLIDFAMVTGPSSTVLPSEPIKSVTVKSISGTVTVSSPAGTIDGDATKVLTTDQAATFVPIVAGWAII